MKNILILVSLSLLIFQAEAQVTQHNEDGSSVSINSGTITASSGTVTGETQFTSYLPGVSLNSAVSQVLTRINAKSDTKIWVHGKEYLVSYKDKTYHFDTQVFSSKANLIEYLNPWMKEKLLKKI